MKMLISASNALSKWLGLELPRISGIDGKGVGTQPVTTTTATVAWQCHIVDNHTTGLVIKRLLLLSRIVVTPC